MPKTGGEERAISSALFEQESFQVQARYPDLVQSVRQTAIRCLDGRRTRREAFQNGQRRDFLEQYDMVFTAGEASASIQVYYLQFWPENPQQPFRSTLVLTADITQGSPKSTNVILRGDRKKHYGLFGLFRGWISGTRDRCSIFGEYS
ncbi:MAG: hypothetical protein M3O22_01290 [Pseudomonadota bacterium]|nr:hypothetical protein [Pseudomonadota bacterium]